MMGISYGGISQLFVGATDPPHLAAITPLSVIDNTATTLYPGGILNTGFALSWAKDRVHDARAGLTDRRPALGLQAHPERRHDVQGEPGAAPRGGRPAGEDPQQQLLRPAVADPLAPVKFVHKIKRAGVPRLPVDRRADGRPLPDLASRLTGTDASGSRSRTARTSTRSTRRPSTAGTTSSSSTWRSRRPALRAAQRWRRRSTARRWASTA